MFNKRLKNRILQLQVELMEVNEEKNKLELVIEGLNKTIKAQGTLLACFSSYICSKDIEEEKTKTLKIKTKTNNGGKKWKKNN